MEQASLRLMTAMQKRGHSFSLISLNPVEGLGPLLDAAGIPAQGLDYDREGKVRSLFRLRRAVRDSNADALIMTGHNFAASLGIAGVGPKRRLLAIHYHHEGVMPKWRWRLIYRAARCQFQTVSFASDFVRREAEAIFPSIKPLAATIYSPLDLPPLPAKASGAQLRGQFEIPADAPVIGNAGWLIQRKRFDVFLRTAALINREVPTSHFLIAGNGELRAELEALAKTLGIADRVHFTGWLSDLDPFYAGIDVLLFNSDWDCFGLTAVEAMARAIPVVASVRNGGLGEVLDESNGWLNCDHDEEWLSRSVIEALGPEGRRRGAMARERVRIANDPDHIAQQVETCLSGGGLA